MSGLGRYRQDHVVRTVYSGEVTYTRALDLFKNDVSVEFVEIINFRLEVH